MRIPLFKMERMQSTYENYVEYNLSESGVQPMRTEELLEPARREKIFARTRSTLRTNLPPLEAWIRSHGDLLEYTPPLAGAIACMKYKLPIGSIELADRLRKEQSMFSVAGDQCGVPVLIVSIEAQSVYLGLGIAPEDRVIAFPLLA